jgi:outer membrane protein OmpA-like peptidoglycan-associated protein
MSFNILDAVKGYLTPDLISKAGSFLGESESGIGKAISGILPSMLGGVISKASSGNTGADEVFNMAKESHSSGLLGGLGNIFGDGGGLLGKGAGLLKSIFGDKMGGIADTIAGFAGIKSSSASSLMSLAAPVALGTLGKHASETGLNAGGLMNLLSSQKDSIMKMLPGGLGSLAGMLGMGKIGDAVSSITGGAKETVASAGRYAEDAARKTGGGLKWLVPLLLIAAAGLGAWYFFFKDKPKETPPAETSGVTTPVTPPDSVKQSTPVVPGAPESMKVKLSDGTEISAFKGGVEDKLVAFLNDASATIDTAKGNWFDFDNLNFELGKSVITKESMVQVQNLAAILKSYPNLKIKIGGYTDKKGIAAGNLKLSQARADAVVAALKSIGANAAQITGAKGYGSQFATVDAGASDEERRKDRRTAVKVEMK